MNGSCLVGEFYYFSRKGIGATNAVSSFTFPAPAVPIQMIGSTLGLPSSNTTGGYLLTSFTMTSSKYAVDVESVTGTISNIEQYGYDTSFTYKRISSGSLHVPTITYTNGHVTVKFESGYYLYGNIGMYLITLYSGHRWNYVNS